MMPNHFASKTMAGLALIMGVAVVMALLGKLTPELVEVLKYTGGAFMSVRVAANVGESFGKK